MQQEKNEEVKVESIPEESNTEKEEQINNFKVENMENLESEDPWVKKKESESEN